MALDIPAAGVDFAGRDAQPLWEAGADHLNHGNNMHWLERTLDQLKPLKHRCPEGDVPHQSEANSTCQNSLLAETQ